ncbi:heterokaryon incompatibility protein-like protein [Rhexocercosporidium sp. MPI-PUGE-AT-0058]|nr:heterokaryon incompatibility protein-like protein [Rhexocercosporidium sp. MPI-PUGE-AT-0058]
MENFQYQPIAPPDEIRMLEILPGAASAPIHVRLIHQRLSHMPHCIALSYEWGSPTRDFEIICEGMILKVTENLVKALRILRGFQGRNDVNSDPGRLNITERTLFWIDAISIDQDDLDERSRQVPLMSSIYANATQVVVWLGEELATTQEAWNLLVPLSDQANDFDDILNDENRDRYRSTLVSPGVKLKDLDQHDLWDAVVDLFCSRTVFRRLWTLQETCLAPRGHITLLCGAMEMDWKTFHNISSILLRCITLWAFSAQAFEKLATLSSTVQREFIKSKIPLYIWNLSDVLILSSVSLVSDRRDYIFGVLGMFDKDTRATFAHLGYHNLPGEIFRAATEVILATGTGSLNYLIYKQFVRGNEDESALPSWVWMFDYWQGLDHLWGNNLHELQGFDIGQRGGIDDNAVLVQGLVFDDIIAAYPNFSPENFEMLLLNIHFDLLADTAAAQTNERGAIFDKIWQRNIRGFREFDRKKQYEGCVARAAVREWERSIVDIDDVDSSWRGISLLTLQEKSLLGDKEYDALLLYYMVRRDQDELLTGEGRNIFVTSKGYYGVGIFGKHGPDCESVVRVHDKIVLIPGVEQPLVLRPCGNTGYRFVGPAYAPRIEMDESLQEGNRKPMEQLRIL